MRAVRNRHAHIRLVVEPELDRRAPPVVVTINAHGHVVDARRPFDVVRARAIRIARFAVQLHHQIAGGIEDLDGRVLCQSVVTTHDLQVVWWRLRWGFRGRNCRSLGWLLSGNNRLRRRLGRLLCGQLKEVAVVEDEILEERVVYSSRRERVITVRVELPRGAEAVGLKADSFNICHVYIHKK